MPFYRYDCLSCGEFEELGSLSRFDAPAACPACGASSPRTLAAPQPRFVAVAATLSPGRAGAHAAGCGCCSAGRKRALKLKGPVAPAMPSFLSGA